MAPERSVCPVGTTAQPLANGRRGAKRAFGMVMPKATIERPGVFSPLTFTKEGGERMTDYELIMINLTVLSLVVGLLVTLITINKR